MAIKIYLHSSVIPHTCCALQVLNNISAEIPPSSASQEGNASKPSVLRLQIQTTVEIYEGKDKRGKDPI